MKTRFLLTLFLSSVAFVLQLFAEATTEPATSAETSPSAGEVTEVKESFPQSSVHGTFRYRFEIIDTETADSFDRDRVSAKVELLSQLHKRAAIGFGLATGAPDPVSTNQTLDNGFSTKDIGLNLAYVDLQPDDRWFSIGVKLGKFKNPFLSPGGTELIWDNDLNPEGLAFYYEEVSGNFTVLVNFGGFWVEENNAADDIMLGGLQLATTYALMAELDLTFGTSYYQYSDLEGAATVFDTADSFGNTTSATGTYTNNYEDLEGFLVLAGKSVGIPWAVSGDLVYNLGADNNNLGWLAGFSLGKAKEAFTFQFNYDYRYLASDAVLGAFTDSDFGGGGTDVKGHKLGFAFALPHSITPAVSYFFNQQGVAGGTDLHRLQVDLKFSF
jgi:hypothetical protein